MAEEFDTKNESVSSKKRPREDENVNEKTPAEVRS